MKNNRGFTLIEVIAALAVIATSLAAALFVNSQASQAEIRLRDKTLAQWVAQNQATELQVTKQWPNPGERSGTVKMAGQEWRWQASINSTDVAELRKMDIKVSRPPETEPLVTLVSFLTKP